VTAAIDHGAHLVMMPPLSCMSQVTDRGLTFSEAAEGVIKSDRPRLSFFDQERVAIWWQKAVPAFIASIPPLWLPYRPGAGPTVAPNATERSASEAASA
jgi:hypothetical protein